MKESLGLSDVELGERLRVARERAGITQAEAAARIEVARTTLLSMEQGKRTARLAEVQLLASAYGVTTNSLLRTEAVHIDLLLQFRKHMGSPTEVALNAAQLLQDLVSAEVELEEALGVRRQRSYPLETPLLPGDVVAQAEHDASELRRFLGIGWGPIPDLVGVLEVQLGIRVYVRPLDSKVSGLFAYNDRVGACMLLNSKHAPARVRASGGHETGHFMGTRRVPQVDLGEERRASPEERYANAFGASLLMPAQSVKKLFAELTTGQSYFTTRHVILMAHTFGVSPEALVRRLEDLGIRKPKTWEWFQAKGGITADHFKEVIGDGSAVSEPSLHVTGLVPRRLSLLGIEAFKRGLYSEGQLAELLAVSRHEVREILDGAEEEAMGENDHVRLPH